jgi:DNA-binding transcriptional MerR regulator
VSEELRIGEVAGRAGVNIQTLRYYERRGLLDPSSRRPSGQRVYSDGAVATVRVIKAAQQLGFTLAEIEELIELSAHRRGTDELRARAAAKVAEIDRKLAHLRTIREALRNVVTADCDALTHCSCGQACPLPFLEVALRPQ